ncbi:unnamed protein product, partial [Discosporangium mesarthrocarpum]
RGCARGTPQLRAAVTMEEEGEAKRIDALEESDVTTEQLRVVALANELNISALSPEELINSNLSAGEGKGDNGAEEAQNVVEGKHEREDGEGSGRGNKGDSGEDSVSSGRTFTCDAEGSMNASATPIVGLDRASSGTNGCSDSCSLGRSSTSGDDESWTRGSVGSSGTPGQLGSGRVAK